MLCFASFLDEVSTIRLAWCLLANLWRKYLFCFPLNFETYCSNQWYTNWSVNSLLPKEKHRKYKVLRFSILWRKKNVLGNSLMLANSVFNLCYDLILQVVDLLNQASLMTNDSQKVNFLKQVRPCYFLV